MTLYTNLVIAFFLLINGALACHPVPATVRGNKPKADSVYICKSASAYAYHTHICRGLAHCAHMIIKVGKADAIKFGYKPCKICYSYSRAIQK